jgi:formylglycine-generating enzyme required for sulfatase activity
MDTYEVSPSEACLYDTVSNQLETETNLAVGECVAVSVPEAYPWNFVTYTQAQQLCARAGKRLPKNEEWYKVAIGMSNPEACFESGKNEPSKTGSGKCLTPTNVHDLVGNVWEWMDDVATNGKYKDRLLPESGYVDLVDNEGVVINTSQTAKANFGKDYAWVNNEGVRGILRGGFYGSGEDGGIFSQNASVSLDFASVGVGFRCVRDL